MDLNEWVMSCDNPTHAKYEADRLWQQGLRSGDRTIIILQYGYSEHDADILCSLLANFEAVATVRANYYNPEIGF